MLTKFWTYEDAVRTIWIDCSAVRGETLIGRADLQLFIDILGRKVEAKEGPVEAVNCVFSDPAAARYNRDSLSFARIGTYVSRDGTRAPLEFGDAPSFEAREDFGIDPKT